MKPLSAHAINQFVDGNQTIRFYLELSDQYYHDRKFNWRHQSYWFNLEGRQVSLTPLGNFIYGNARRYLERFLGGDPRSVYMEQKPIHLYSPHCELVLDRVQARVDIDLNGAWCIVDNCPFLKPGNTWYYKFRVNSHNPLTPHEVTRVVWKKIQSQLYPNGLFRDIQLHFQCDKADAKRYFKLYFTGWTQKVREDHWDVTDAHRAMLRHLRRKHNIILTNSDPLNYRIDYLYALQIPRPKKRVEINAMAWHISYNDIENWCYYNGIEVSEDTIPIAFDAILDGKDELEEEEQ